MAEEQIIALLTEIRDLQKQNVDNYQQAMRKQQEAIDLQKQNVSEFKRRYIVWQRFGIVVVVVIVIVLCIILSILPSLTRVHR
jgi:uncharacterized protein (UPF0305 family)